MLENSFLVPAQIGSKLKYGSLQAEDHGGVCQPRTPENLRRHHMAFDAKPQPNLLDA